MAQEWCEQHGHVLDTSLVLEDLGMSGFSGANLKKGALKALHQLCQDGKIEPGTILLIEALDRLTRMPLPEAAALMLSLINSGLTIVTLTDGKVWDQSGMANLEPFLMSVLTLFRGHQESEYKSSRLRKTFAHHRDIGSQQAFGSAPGWLSRADKHSPWLVDQEKAEVVRKVFEMCALGYGSKSIAKQANKENWPVPTRLNRTDGRWHAQMPGILLRNRAVLGEHEHHIHTHEARAESWHGLPTGRVNPDYYPRIVDEGLWNRAQASIETRRVAKRRDAHYFNIWTGLLFCGHCGAPLQRKAETRGRSHGSVDCADKIAGITKCPPMAINHLDLALLQSLYRIGISLGIKPNQDRESEIAALEGRQRELNVSSERLAEAIAITNTPIKPLTAKLNQVASELHEIRLKLESIKQSRELTDAELFFDDSFIEHAAEHLYLKNDESRDVRASLHLTMARFVEEIWVWSYEVALVKCRYDDTALHVIPLPSKQLPSRANPAAKYHKPPQPKPRPPKPYLELALQGKLIPPPPQRRNGPSQKPVKPYLIASEE
jgi:DNA invertase Pin-like site-specific DNA recombinase